MIKFGVVACISKHKGIVWSLRTSLDGASCPEETDECKSSNGRLSTIRHLAWFFPSSATEQTRVYPFEGSLEHSSNASIKYGR